MARQLKPLPLALQQLNGVELHGNAVDAAALQAPAQVEKRLRVVLERFGVDRDQQQRQAGATPVALQQMQFIHHAVHQLQWVISQIADAVLKDGGCEGQITLALAVETGCVLRFDAFQRQSTELKSRVGSNLAQACSKRI